MATKRPTLKVAVLLTFEAQLLDLSGIDLFGMLSKEYIEIGLPQPLVDVAMDVKIYYVGKDGADDGKPELRSLTAQAAIRAEVSTNAAVVQPGAIEVLMIPGPPPQLKLPKSTLDFVRAHSDRGTTILTVCTGCNVAAQAGILDGRNASGPRALVPQLRKDFSKVIWDDSRRFVKDVRQIDGRQHEIWSSGGVTNGLEMIAAYIREKYPGPLSEAVCAMADVGDKGEFYGSSVSVDNAWWLGQILRAFFFGKRGSR